MSLKLEKGYVVPVTFSCLEKGPRENVDTESMKLNELKRIVEKFLPPTGLSQNFIE